MMMMNDDMMMVMYSQPFVLPAEAIHLMQHARECIGMIELNVLFVQRTRCLDRAKQKKRLWLQKNDLLTAKIESVESDGKTMMLSCKMATSPMGFCLCSIVARWVGRG